MNKRISILMVIILALTAGCKKEENKPAGNGWADHLLVINEGPFQNGSGSISAYNRKTDEVTQDLFKTVNGRPLGNIVQSITLHRDRFYIVINNADRVEVVDAGTFESAGAFSNVPFPSAFVGFDDKKGYLSCWDGSVKVLDLSTFEVSASIAVGTGPDRMILAKDLWVANSGGFGVDSTISVIDTGSDTVIRTIITGHVPSGMVADDQGNIWVLCSGRGWNGFPSPDDTPGRLVCYHPENYSVIRELIFSSTDSHPDLLIKNPEWNTLYFNHPQGIFAYSTSSGELPANPLVSRSTKLYGIGFDPASDMILGADAGDYVQNGWAYFYDPQSGAAMDSIRTGVIPNGFWAGE